MTIQKYQSKGTNRGMKGRGGRTGRVQPKTRPHKRDDKTKTDKDDLNKEDQPMKNRGNSNKQPKTRKEQVERRRTGGGGGGVVGGKGRFPLRLLCITPSLLLSCLLLTIRYIKFRQR
jgi:hypothetical protein